jgi:putative PIN family toxin of toxin-antitoxin system
VRIVLDTNVVLSALLWRGTPYTLLQLLRQHQHFQLFVSPVLLEELGEVLSRPMSADRLRLIGRTAREVLAEYYDAVEVVTPLTVPAVVAADADDDHVIAAAVAANADLLISGDRHLLALGTHAGTRIISPAAAMQALIQPTN